jgi:hypothetical protein
MDAVAPWVIDGVAGVALTATVALKEELDPLHPFATTLTVALPENPEAHVTVPVRPLPAMVLPLPVIDQV